MYRPYPYYTPPMYLVPLCTGAAATGAKAPGLAALRAAVLGAALPAKRLKSAVFLESPEKIRGIEEMDEETSFKFEDGELQREDEKLAHRPLQPSLPSQQGFTCSCCLSRKHFTAYPFCVCCGFKVL